MRLADVWTRPTLIVLILLAMAAIVGFISMPFDYGKLLAQATPAAPRHETAVLLAPPRVPPPIDRRQPATVAVDLETKEMTGTLATGVEYKFWTFNGTVPGPMVRVRVGDTVQITLKNSRDSVNLHSLNLHAVTGPGGGGEFQVGPGARQTFEWKALNPGLYVYHCMTPHVPVHIAQGMYGLILVEPESGMRHVDREYYVMQGEFYTKGATLEPGLQAFDSVKAHADRPEYVVFNGRMDSLLDRGALTAKTNDLVRLFVGNGGPSMTSSFHVVGSIFERVYENGAIGGPPVQNSQMTLIPPGSSAIVEFKVPVPGRYFLVDHNYFRGHEKGTVGMLQVDGPEAPSIFSGVPDGPRVSAHQ
jgi:nitrite reductase (NO-forming)